MISGALATGSSRFDLSVADVKFQGESGGDLAGYSVADAGDLDGDALGDVVVGAIYQDIGGSSGGAAYLLLSAGVLAGTSGTTSLSDADVRLGGEAASDSAGNAVAGAGDVNGDGFSDLLVGDTTSRPRAPRPT